MPKKQLRKNGEISVGVSGTKDGVFVRYHGLAKPKLVARKAYYAIEEYQMPIGMADVDGIHREVFMYIKIWAPIRKSELKRMQQMAANERMIKRSPILW